MDVAILIAIGVVAVCLVIGVWVGVALGLAGIVAVLAVGRGDLLGGVGFAVWNTVNNPVLTSVPLFLLMGQVILRSGISRSFYRAVSLWLDRAPGGLLQTNIVASGIFAAISGNSVATAATVSEVAAPELASRGYRTDASLGSIAGGGTLGILIPPSIPLILYGALVSESVVDLFTAALLPGLLLMVAFMGYVAIRFRRPVRTDTSGSTSRGDVTWGARFAALRHVVPVLALIALVLSGIYAGVVTVTEAAALGAGGAIVLALLYRSLDTTSLMASLQRSAWVTSMIMLIVIGASILSYGVAITGAARELTAYVTEVAPSVTVFLIVVCALFLVLGLFMEGLSMMMLTLPILYPLLEAYQVDMVWFGVITVILIEIGLITPPVGMNLFVLQGVTGESIKTIARGALPYIAIMLGLVVTLWVFPEVVTWLPSMR